MTGTVALLFVLVWMFMKTGRVEAPAVDQNVVVWTLQNYGYAILIVIGAIILGALGVKLVGAAGQTVPIIIPPQDYELLAPLIQKGDEKAIGTYVVLSSLSGFTGTFQKIGFAGLPLATALLTIIFAALSFFEKEFLELAKLTLGAFIGSFVQKGQAAPKLPTLE
ncbi:MAG: hypothetical protein QNJ22_15135 [Desulfosarcinaceae bacterium]|nr:hypothetical protein [Desulfosarcinaceae bacterium]